MRSTNKANNVNNANNTKPMNASTWVVEIAIETQFYDVDPMNVVWHGNYVRYLEIARSALLDKMDYNYPQMKASGYAWPIIDLHVRYIDAICFPQTINVRCELKEWENRLVFHYLITDKVSGKCLTKAETTQVAIDAETKTMCFISPPILLKKLGFT